MNAIPYVFFAALISFSPTMSQAQTTNPPAPPSTAVAGNGPLARALVEFTTCFQTAVDRVAANIALENSAGRGVDSNQVAYKGGLVINSPTIKLPYTDHIKWYTEGYANGNGWANGLMQQARMAPICDPFTKDRCQEFPYQGVPSVALVAAVAGHGAAMVIGEQNLCVKRLNEQLKY